jgi:hypothetical protein
MHRYPTAITQKHPRPKWQTFHWWWEWFRDGLTGLVFLGALIGYAIMAAWAINKIFG